MRAQNRVNGNKFIAGAVFLCCAVTLLRAEDAGPSRADAELGRQIEAFISQPKFAGAVWGIKVLSLDSGETIFEHHADRLMSPASNAKLYTAALALDQLGGDFRFSTPVYASGEISRNGILRGNLIIAGQGDPSWNERRAGTNFGAALEPFVAILGQAGVRRVDGDIIADASFFYGPPTGASWTVDDLNGGQAGLVSALSLDDNVAQLRVTPGKIPGEPCALNLLEPGTGIVLSNRTVTVAADRPARLELFRAPDGPRVYVLGEMRAGSGSASFDLAVPDPAHWFGTALKLALEKRGIVVTGKVRAVSWPEAGINPTACHKLGAVTSPPLKEVTRGFLKASQNLEADLILAEVGELSRSSNAAGQSSEAAGLAALNHFLAAMGVPPREVEFDEGSGLSRNNLATANATATLLKYMAQHREAEAFMSALPVAGADGTLKERFRNTAAAGNARAKTGTLRWANALSGYVHTAGGEHLAFSIMLNRFVAEPGHNGEEEIDPIVVMLANGNSAPPASTNAPRPR